MDTSNRITKKEKLMQENWTDHPDMQRILAYVLWYRQQHPDVPVMPGRKPEGSCIAFGEFNNLLYMQLICTPELSDSWHELKDKQVRAGVLQQITRDILRFRQRGQKVQIPEWSDQTFD